MLFPKRIYLLERLETNFNVICINSKISVTSLIIFTENYFSPITRVNTLCEWDTFFTQLLEEEAVLLVVEEEGVAEVEEEGEEDDHTCGSQSIQCRFVKWKECCIIVAIKIV